MSRASEIHDWLGEYAYGLEARKHDVMEEAEKEIFRLAHIRDDDGEGLGEEWFIEKGGVVDDNDPECLTFDRLCNTLRLARDKGGYGAYLVNDDESETTVYLRHVFKKGDVRELCRGLGIPLKGEP